MHACSQNKILCVGVDVGAKTNKVRVLDNDGNDVCKPLSIPNTRRGAEQLEALITELLAEQDFHSVRIGMEATSFYDWHLAEYLAQSPSLAHVEHAVYRLDPRRIRNFKKSYAEEDKTDPFDAFVIADFVRFHRLPAAHRPADPFAPLRHLTRYRYHLVRMIVREKNYFISRLFLQFSGFSQQKPLSNTFGATAEALLETWTPDEIATLPETELVDFIVRHSRNRVPNPEAVAAAVRRAARESYRLRPELAASVQRVLAMALENIRALRKTLKEIDQAIAKELNAFPNTLESIPGIGPVYAAGILAEIGDIERFPSPDKIAKMAGLVWPRNQSAEFEADDRKRARHGNKFLRYYFIEAANALRVHNAEYRTYHGQKAKEVNKHAHKRALVLTARKLVRLVFSLLKKNQLYSPSYHTQRSTG